MEILRGILINIAGGCVQWLGEISSKDDIIDYRISMKSNSKTQIPVEIHYLHAIAQVQMHYSLSSYFRPTKEL